jgi:bacillithiol synthase
MDCRALAFRQLAHQPALFLAYLEKSEKVKPFYTHTPTMEAVRQSSRKLDYPQPRRAEVAEILGKQNAALGAGAATSLNLERLAKGALAVVSGQQVGLFGGPAYAVYKALTAIQLAGELTRGGIEAVPVFWMATEDHDLEEVRHTSWFDAGKMIRYELPDGNEAGKPVGRIALGPDAEGMAREAAGLLERDGGELLAQSLTESYKAEETYGSAFGKLFARLFAQQGLVLLDPLDAGLHKVAAPIYQHALGERDELIRQLLERGKELDRAGFDATVKVTSKSTLLFRFEAGARQVLTANNGSFHAGDKSWPRQELVQMTHREPEKFSPNALLRPVVQDFLLPTVASIAGPTEISYLAQSEVVYRHLLGRMPVLLPRAGFTLVDAKARKLLSKYELEVEDVWAGSQDLRRKMEKQSVTGSLANEFERHQAQIAEMLTKLGERIETLDPTLKGTVDKAKEGIQFHLDKLRRKAGAALDQKAGLLVAHEEHLESLLNPHKGLQERELCLLPFLARWGVSAFDELQKLCASNKLGHHFIVEFP